MTTTVTLDTPIMSEAPLVPRVVLGSSDAPTTTGRVSVGRTEPILLTAADPTIDADLAGYLRAHQQFAFWLLSFTCNFRFDEDPIIRSDVGVRLTSTGAASVAPVIWSMSPERLASARAHSRQVTLGPTAQFLGVEMSLGSVSQTDRTVITDSYVIGTGRGEAIAEWVFRRVGGHEIDGMQDLGLVIRGATDSASALELRMTASVRRRAGGLIPYRADLPASVRLVSVGP